MTLRAPSEKDSALIDSISDSATSPAAPEDNNASSDAVMSSVFIGQGPVLKNWKIMADEPQQDQDRADDVADTSEEEISPVIADVAQLARRERKYSERRIATSRPVAPIWLQIGQALAVFMTVAWVTYAAIYVMAEPGIMKAITSSPLNLGGLLASVLAPVAMLWLCIATWQRRSDAHLYAQALKEELRGLLFPSEDESSLLGDDIRQLMKQATEMSASSRAAIKAIQRARSGLRSEIRDFAGVSQKAEFHIDRLADTLGKRAEELLSLTETIEAQTTVIQDKSQRGITAWENISAEIGELGDEIDQIFTNGGEKLATASDTAITKIKTVEESLLDAFDTLSEKINDVSGKIHLTGDKLDGQSDRLLEVSVAITTGADKLESSINGAKRVSDAVESVMDAMTTSVAKVENTTETLFARTDVIEKTLEERAGSLKLAAEMLLENTANLKDVGDVATHKLGEALAMAISGADTINNAVRRSRDLMEQTVLDATDQITETSRISEEKFGTLMKTATHYRDQLTALIGDMDRKHENLTEAIVHLDQAHVTIIDVTDKAQTSLVNAAAMMEKRTQEPMTIIKGSIERLEEQTQVLDDRLAVRVAEIGQETGKLRGMVDEVDATLKGSLQDFSQTAGHVKSHIAQMEDDLQIQRKMLADMLADMNKTADEAARILEKRQKALSEKVDESHGEIENLSGELFDKGDALLLKIAEASGTITGYESRILDVLRSIDMKSLETETRVKGSIESLNGLAAVMEPECRDMVDTAEKLCDRYTRLKENYLASTEVATNCLVELGGGLDHRLEKLSEGTMEASRNMLGMTDNLTLALRDIRQVSEDTQERLAQIQTGVKGRTDDLQLVTDQVRLKVEALQGNLEGYIKGLGTTVGKAIEGLTEATEQFAESTENLDTKADATLTKLLDGSRQYREQGDVLSNIGEKAVEKTAQIVRALRDESQSLVTETTESLGTLQKVSETLSVRAREMEEFMKGSVIMTQNYGDELRTQASLVAEKSAQSVEAISEAASKLAAKSVEIRKIGDGTVESIEDSRQKLSAEGARLEGYTRAAISAMDEAGNVFTKHSGHLYKTVGEMAEQAKKFREQQARIERESFLSAAKFVIESLYSLAVDVARHMESDLDDRVLKAYQKGDVAAFAKHLAEVAPRIPLDKSQRKFIEDSEFRVYVLRFVRQFEELLEQAHANDYADLLSSVFSTSDIGKLYRVLCDIAGRSAKIH